MTNEGKQCLARAASLLDLEWSREVNANFQRPKAEAKTECGKCKYCLETPRRFPCQLFAKSSDYQWVQAAMGVF